MLEADRIDIVRVDIKPSIKRVAIVIVNYYGLEMLCELVIYRKDKETASHLWVRMPEVWMTPDSKKRFNWFSDKESAADFQKILLLKIQQIHGLDLAKAVDIDKNFRAKKQVKKLDKIQVNQIV